MNEFEKVREIIKSLESSASYTRDLKLLIEELKELMSHYHSKPLSTKEVSLKYQISTRTISRWVASGRLKPISNHGKYLFNEEDIRNIF